MTKWLDAPSVLSTAIFTAGWAAGWAGFLLIRRVPKSAIQHGSSGDDVASSRAALSVIIPCRNEAENLVVLLPLLAACVQPEDQIIVVNDDSTDDTANVARQYGAEEVQVGSLPPDWAGKPHACWHGVQHAKHDVLLFVDADVRLGNTALRDVLAVLGKHPEALVSVMPWHRTVYFWERLSMLFNVISSMVGGDRRLQQQRRIAYGPLMAVYKESYLRSGGHAHQSVRGAVVEDIALARVMPAGVPLIAEQHQVEYRMYTTGCAQLWEGWTKNTATGAALAPRWLSALIIAWVVSLCGGAVTSMWFYFFSVVQVFIFARRVGNFGVWSAVLYPIHAVVFVVIALRSALQTGLVGSVTWRGRRIATR